MAGTADQVDLNLNVKERQTGALLLGVGFSSAEKIILSGSISQSNIFGSGNALSLQVNSGKINKVYAVSFTNPYFTPDGVSLGYDVYRRETNTSSLNTVVTYKTGTTGAGVRFGVPIAETSAINFGLAAEQTHLTLGDNPPQRFIDFVNQFGTSTTALRSTASWARDGRDSIFYPTKGTLQEVGGELTLPVAELRYYRLNYRHQWLYPAADWLTLALNGELGYANGYGGRPLPFFKNFFAGGVSSVRGFRTSTLGPKDINGDAVGGNRRIVFNAEMLFPMPGFSRDKNLRLSGFVDGGNVFGKDEKISLGDLRYSAGLAISWFSPIGPLKVSFAQPIKKDADDKIERFQFQLGTVF